MDNSPKARLGREDKVYTERLKKHDECLINLTCHVANPDCSKPDQTFVAHVRIAIQYAEGLDVLLSLRQNNIHLRSLRVVVHISPDRSFGSTIKEALFKSIEGKNHSARKKLRNL